MMSKYDPRYAPIDPIDPKAVAACVAELSPESQEEIEKLIAAIDANVKDRRANFYFGRGCSLELIGALLRFFDGCPEWRKANA